MPSPLDPKKPPPAAPPKPGADDWKPCGPGFEINGLGQRRTVNHQPGNVPTFRKTPKGEAP